MANLLAQMWDMGAVESMLWPVKGYYKGLHASLTLPLIFFTNVMKIANLESFPTTLFVKFVIHQQVDGKCYTQQKHTWQLFRSCQLERGVHPMGNRSVLPSAGFTSAATEDMDDVQSATTRFTVPHERHTEVFPAYGYLEGEVSILRGFAKLKFRNVENLLPFDPYLIIGVLDTVTLQKINSNTFAVHMNAPEVPSTPTGLKCDVQGDPESMLLDDTAELRKRRKMDNARSSHDSAAASSSTASAATTRVAAAQQSRPDTLARVLTSKSHAGRSKLGSQVMMAAGPEEETTLDAGADSMLVDEPDNTTT